MSFIFFSPRKDFKQRRRRALPYFFASLYDFFPAALISGLQQNWSSWAEIAQKQLNRPQSARTQILPGKKGEGVGTKPSINSSAAGWIGVFLIVRELGVPWVCVCVCVVAGKGEGSGGKSAYEEEASLLHRLWKGACNLKVRLLNKLSPIPCSLVIGPQHRRDFCINGVMTSSLHSQHSPTLLPSARAGAWIWALSLSKKAQLRT